MALSNAVQGARHTAQVITWTDTEGDAQNLTGATVTGRLLNLSTYAATAITGALAVTSAASGIFTWTYSAADVATPGTYEVQFVATYGSPPNDTTDKTLIERWVVERAMI